MAGPMTSPCDTFRAEATELLLLGRPLPEPLGRHLAACADCAGEAEGVRRVMRTFERAASPRAAGRDQFAAPPEAPGRRGGAFPPGARRRRLAGAAAALALAACAAFAAVDVSLDDGGGSATTAGVTLSREGRMTDHSWGTEVPVSVSGLLPGQTYRMMTGNADGELVPAGSLRAGPRDAPTHTRMVTAMARNAITMLVVQDADRNTVARLPVPPRGSRS
ncbi:hypothetical protein LHJ74_31270 [Streptomyces sp. N2-109]|uniref:Zinc-finger domain-containing protein n=1 Tax=Streptomyces gossypii TaxID=2883101 RepID=A0ABT2K2D9_9ACTN|nr:hypothetical protein [Streptomyces gossypii]MCT2594336.1 hypothetical protein [Streptomyces gossypii]